MRRSAAGILQSGGACVLLALAALSCKHTGVGPDGGGSSGFLFKLTVVNSAGQPVPGLQVSVSNSMSPLPLSPGYTQVELPRGIEAVTSIRFDAPVKAHVNFAVMELSGAPVSTLMDRDLPGAGSYLANFTVPHSYGTRAYKCRLLATDTATGLIIFRDSVYAVLWNADPTLGVIGSTSAAGTFQTQDSLHFPNLLDLPPLVFTNATDPTPIGTFYVPDSVNVVLADTVAQLMESYVCTIKRGTNDIHLVWNPVSTGQSRLGPGQKSRSRAPAWTDPPEFPPTAWKLYQNYPNPFN